jgi:hypothetical protein
LIDAIVSRLYSPNAGNELCVLRFRDGKTRTVAARELVSGRLLRQLSGTACRSAFRRALRGGDAGVCLADIDLAVAEALERLATTLTVRNVRAYLADLPQDVDVVAVEPVHRKVRSVQSYMNGSTS